MRLIENSREEHELLDWFLEALGEQSIRDFSDQEMHPVDMSDQEIFILFSLKNIKTALRMSQSIMPDLAKSDVEVERARLQKMCFFQLGSLTNSLEGHDWDVWRQYRDDWINSMIAFYRYLRQLGDHVVTEQQIYNYLLIRYFTGLYYDVGFKAYVSSKQVLGDQYSEGSDWYHRLNLIMTNLSSNLNTIFSKRGGLYYESHKRFVYNKLEILGHCIVEIQSRLDRQEHDAIGYEQDSTASLLKYSALFLNEAFRDAHGVEVGLNIDFKVVEMAAAKAIAASPDGELPEGIRLPFWLGYVALTELELASGTTNSYFA